MTQAVDNAGGHHKVALHQKIGFLGYGNMGQAIARGLIEAGQIEYNHLVLFDLDRSKLADFESDDPVHARQRLAHVADSPENLAAQSDVLVLATKPQDMESALQSLKPSFSLSTLVISIAAGLSIAFFQQHLGESARVIRVMPNTPALVGAGAAAYAMSETCTAEDEQLVRTIFDAVGTSVRVSESAIDAVTALSGSGPAYYFYLVECFVEAGVELGLPKADATELAVQTLYGAGKMLKESGETAATLRENVTSKGGTTFAALESFRSSNLDRTVLAALTAARDRSRELGK